MIVLNDSLVKKIHETAEKQEKSLQAVCEMIVRHFQKKGITTQTAKQLLSDIRKFRAR